MGPGMNPAAGGFNNNYGGGGGAMNNAAGRQIYVSNVCYPALSPSHRVEVLTSVRSSLIPSDGKISRTCSAKQVRGFLPK